MQNETSCDRIVASFQDERRIHEGILEENDMNIVIMGCGKIGADILANMVMEGHDVTVIDQDATVLNDITNVYDVMTMCGNGTDYDTLMEAGVAEAELYMAMTLNDELNFMSCFLARKMGAKHTVARISNPEYRGRGLAFIKQQANISMFINPDQITAAEIFNTLKLPNGIRSEYFSKRNFEMIEMQVKEYSPLIGHKLYEIRNKIKAKFLVCVVRRGDQVFIPDGNFELKKGDMINLTASPSEVDKLLKACGYLEKGSRDVMILGGSGPAYYLGKMLAEVHSSVKIIERDRQRCRELCEAIPQAVVINGDGAKQEILLEEGLASADAFVSLTGIDEENILMSIFAASQNVPKAMTKVDRNEFKVMAEKLGLENIVNPKELISNNMVRYARALENSMGSNVETLYKLMDGAAEALEFNVKPSFKKVQIPLKYLDLKPNILIGGIVRGRRTIIPGGDDVIQVGDRVVVIATDQRLYDLSDIFR